MGDKTRECGKENSSGNISSRDRCRGLWPKDETGVARRAMNDEPDSNGD